MDLSRKSYQLSSSQHCSIYLSDRLKACGLTTLNSRRIRGDTTETYKILSGKYDADVVPFMNNACTFSVTFMVIFAVLLLLYVKRL